jgi:hypoxia induced protein
MQTALYYLTTIATLAVLVVLCMGIYTLLGQRSPNLSQKLMRWRVGLQFVAILLIMGFVLLSR